MFVWQNLNSRNQWVFDRKKMDRRIVCTKTLNYLGEHEVALVREAGPNVSTEMSV